MATSLVLVKQFTYRGDPTEEFSNRYYLSGADPPGSTEWIALFDALVAQEKTLYLSSVSVVRGYGYDDDADGAASVWTRDLVPGAITVPGTLSPGTGNGVSGDVAWQVRWKTSRLSSTGKAIYLRKYFHGGLCLAADRDKVGTECITAGGAFGAKMRDGSFLDGRTVRAAGQSSETFLGHSVPVYLTTRTLKRRGRRPTSP